MERNFTVCHTKTVLELCLNAKLVKPYIDLWTSTMYKHGPYADTGQQHKVFDDTCLQA